MANWIASACCCTCILYFICVSSLYPPSLSMPTLSHFSLSFLFLSVCCSCSCVKIKDLSSRIRLAGITSIVAKLLIGGFKALWAMAQAKYATPTRWLTDWQALTLAVSLHRCKWSSRFNWLENMENFSLSCRGRRGKLKVNLIIGLLSCFKGR